MSDLISRQRVIKEIDRFIPVDPMKSDYTQGISVGLAIATRCIEEFSQENHESSQGLVKDLISRKDAIKAVEEERFPVDSDYAEGFMAALDKVGWILKEWLPSAQKAQLSGEGTTKDATSDLISKKEATTIPVMPKEHREYQTMNLDDAYEQGWLDCQKCIEDLPSAEPERLTDDDFETIRIHLNAQKEKLCNQQRWEEAEEYQRIIDRFMAFASAEPEIIRCGQCKYAEAADSEDNQDGYTCQFHRGSIWFSGSYCSWAERREECTP